ncbi:MAG: hypothetical protein NTV58_17265 [Deltaproteobacteria bacterium]|nr:hypothetical protein [Deltaproteobacteria bacterium]
MERAKKLFTINDIRCVAIALTDTCNMRCSYCPHSLPDAFPKRIREAHFPHDLYLKILDYLPNLSGLEYVDLTEFNEFFLTPELATFYLPALKERNVDYMIATNGSIYPDNISYYATHNPKCLIVGLQTITEKQYHDTLRIKCLSFDNYIERVSKLVRYFYNHCKDTLISIEVSYNASIILNKVIGRSYNKEIASLKEQRSNIRSLIRLISQKTGIELYEGESACRRNINQLILAHSSDDRIIFGGKRFVDLVNFYNRKLTNDSPVCFSETTVFMMNGDIKACCTDYKNMTVFANIIGTSMKDIFQRFVSLVNTMRTRGAPFECCKHCLGYETYREKYAKAVHSFIK